MSSYYVPGIKLAFTLLTTLCWHYYHVWYLLSSLRGNSFPQLSYTILISLAIYLANSVFLSGLFLYLPLCTAKLKILSASFVVQFYTLFPINSIQSYFNCTNDSYIFISSTHCFSKIKIQLHTLQMPISEIRLIQHVQNSTN